MIVLDRHLDVADVAHVARDHERVALSDSARARLERNRAYVERVVAEGRTVYGVTTGFGRFATTRIAADKVRELQRNLLLSHAIGVGEPFADEVVRAMMLLRAQSLAHGVSGVRPLVVDTLLALLNADLLPVVPSQGSVGASGDLAPLAHMSLPLIGVGEVRRGGEPVPAERALAELGMAPLELQAKEGLALVNGTQAMAAQLALLLVDAARLLTAADIAAAMSVEALKGSHRPFMEEVSALRPHPGAAAVAANMRLLLEDSDIQRSHVDCDKVQDAYSLRAVPQVHGASRDALSHVRAVLAIELDAVTDNPLVLDERDEVVSAGNFHGQPLALTADYAAIALAEIANISERRVEQMLNPALSGLPAFLAEQGGLQSGLMVSQYTAAALVSENKVLAHPASVDSIPTSANQEDHVSMGTHACRKARSVLENVLWVVAIEVVSAAQGLDFRRPLAPGRGVAAAHAAVRALVPHLDHDRLLAPDLERVRTAIMNGTLAGAVADAVAPLR
ncbi:MAG TPA: histidine ammonia-lyase [Trueperaceae bacterium]|nr:histidine ammonia-lyase [Trueperaceae bacterium]